MTTLHDENERYLNKIKKLLNLARKSTNANEAASAMNKAQALMRERGLTETDARLYDITESVGNKAPSNAKKPPRWQVWLISVIERAFGVKCYTQLRLMNGKWHNAVVFYGLQERPQIADYAFEVLSRQLVAARKEFISSQNKRLKRANLIARADTFCEGWCHGVWNTVAEFAVTSDEQEKVEAFEKTLFSPGSSGLKVRKAKEVDGRNYFYNDGYCQGRNVRLNQGVGGSEQAKIEGGISE